MNDILEYKSPTQLKIGIGPGTVLVTFKDFQEFEL